MTPHTGHCPSCNKKQTNPSKELVDVICWDCEREHDAEKFKESVAYLIGAKITCVDGYISGRVVIESADIETPDGTRFIVASMNKYSSEDGDLRLHKIRAGR